MSAHAVPRRNNNNMTQRRNVRKMPSEHGVHNPRPVSPSNSTVVGGRTVKKLRLSKALTIPEGTTVLDACRRMSARRADAVLLTDSNALLSGIVTDKDIATRVIAEELRPDQTLMSKVMTRNPIYVNSDSLAIDALQKMVQGKFRHLPVVENGEVVAMLDITKCLYDAISRMEKAAEQGSAIAAAVEGVERQFGNNFSASTALVETLREKMFKPTLSTIISENPRVAIVSPSDPVRLAAKKMHDYKVNSVLIMTGNNIQGILTSKDILLQVVAENLSPELTLVEKVMTKNPDCVTLETTILDALHLMHDQKFLHLPVVDKEEQVVACIDVLQITHAAIAMVENGFGTVNDVANSVMQSFWDSALNMEAQEDYDTHSDMSMVQSQYIVASDAEQAKSAYPPVGSGNSFSFKFQDQKGCVHRFNFSTENLSELISAITQRMGVSDDQNGTQLMYEDDEGDKVWLTTDGDLASAVSHAKSLGHKVLRLHVELNDPTSKSMEFSSDNINITEKSGSVYLLRSGILVGAVVLTSIGVVAYLKRSQM